MAYTIVYSPQAERYLLRLTRSQAQRILNHMESIALDPFQINNNIVKLSGTASSFRLRVGDTRVIYAVDTKSKHIYIAKVAPRGSAYTQ